MSLLAGQVGGKRLPWLKRKGSAYGKYRQNMGLASAAPSCGVLWGFCLSLFLTTGKFLGSAYIALRYPLPVLKSRFVSTLLGYGRTWFEWVDLWCNVPI